MMAMTNQDFSLKNPPIVEAVLDIECDLPTSQQVATLEGPAQERFRDRYPKLRKQFVHEHQIKAEPGQLPELSARHAIQGLQFLQADEKQLVQVRSQGFSFNKLAPYTRLGDYLPEIERVWHLYVDLASPVQIRSIRLRYINRIMLPTKGKSVDLDKYLRIGPRLPDEDSLTFTGFLTQQAMLEKKTGNQVHLVLTAQLPEGENLPIILDNIVLTPGPESPGNWPWISERIQQLRALKNHIFRRTVTEECLNLFQ
jgi:uncharacterized protein (TIGR04255 family)